ncbi:hypothetical protein ABPG75_005474 [Micractinium tetrahymenae]
MKAGGPVRVPDSVSAGDGAPPKGSSEDSGVGGGGVGGLTALELQRLQRIRRNQEVMMSMGLGAPTIDQKPAAAAAAPRRPSRKLTAAVADGGGGAPPQPVRRSARHRGAAAGAESGAEAAPAGAAAASEQAPDPEPELHFVDSSVRRYVCELATAGDSSARGGGFASCAAAAPDGARISGFRQLPGCLSDPALARAYSLDWRPGLVAAGGKDGLVSVFGSRQLEAGQLAPDASLPPLLSGKLHRGWVAEVQLLSGAGLPDTAGAAAADSMAGAAAAGLRLLTAGNDGAVCLWDVARAAEAGGRGGVVPQCLARSTSLHQGGIFSLHERGGRILTASKDGTLAISTVSNTSTAASLAVMQRYEELHEGVVKCARWREAGAGDEPSVFASCGNDRQLCVADTRQSPSAGACLAIRGAHGTAINCLRWHPASEHLLLSASHDPAILLHDLRSPGQPLHRLLGHAPAARISQIYQPAFVAGGDAVATGCERSQLLSLYCTGSGAAISRGDAGLTPGATFCRGGGGGGGRGDPLVLSAGRAVHFFAPAWGEQAA